MVGNSLTKLDDGLTKLENLRVLIARHNQLKNAGIPNGIFKLEDLTVIVSMHNLHNVHVFKDQPPKNDLAKAAALLFHISC